MIDEGIVVQQVRRPFGAARQDYPMVIRNLFGKHPTPTRQ